MNDDEFAAIKSDVRQVWIQVLGTSDLDDQRGFFDSGGSSMQLLKVLTLLNGRFADAFKLVDLYEYPTIENQAMHVIRRAVPVDADAGARARLAERRRVYRGAH